MLGEVEYLGSARFAGAEPECYGIGTCSMMGDKRLCQALVVCRGDTKGKLVCSFSGSMGRCLVSEEQQHMTVSRVSVSGVFSGTRSAGSVTTELLRVCTVTYSD